MDDNKKKATPMLMDKIFEVLYNSKGLIEALGSSTDEIQKVHIEELNKLLKLLQSPNPSKEGFYYWILQVGIEKTWVADGLDFTENRLRDTIQRAYGHLHGYEIKAKILSRPPNVEIAKEMGFKTVGEYLKDRKED